MPSLTTNQWFQVIIGFIALGSLVVSIISLTLSLRLKHKQYNLEENREKERQREKDKADIYFWLKRTFYPGYSGTRTCDFLFLENKGQATANDVSILIDDTPVLEHPNFRNNSKDKILAISPNTPPIKYLCERHTGQPYRVKVTWTNKSGEAGSREQRVNLEMP